MIDGQIANEFADLLRDALPYLEDHKAVLVALERRCEDYRIDQLRKLIDAIREKLPPDYTLDDIPF
jgi:hypothetical protein